MGSIKQNIQGYGKQSNNNNNTHDEQKHDRPTLKHKN